jgi:hypothetical protein
MKWKVKSNKIDGVPVKRKFFAFLPVKIGNEVRWLETVTIKGFWVYSDILQKWVFIREIFL